MDIQAFLNIPVEWFAGLALRWKIALSLVVLISLMEFVVRRLAPLSWLYHGWSAAVRTLGEIWTAVILSIVYGFAVGPTNLVFRLTGRDLLDRQFDESASVWRPHIPNPLGPENAARHQF